MTTSLLVALLAIVFAPALSYLVAVRKLSGKIATSEASKLWDEAQSMRDDYRGQLAVATDRIRSLEKLTAATIEELRVCKQVLYELRAKVEAT